jgi:Glycosyl transferases group 1
MTKKIHIIAFDIPFPPNYGGVMDVYWKIFALHSLGIKVILHCFYDERKATNHLTEICEKVYYYYRKTGLQSLPIFAPYMAFSRRSPDLIPNLLNDNAPIFIEGLQSCFQIKAILDATKQKIAVRMHNNESDYYYNLGKSEKNGFKKIYFYWEAFLLQSFEKKLQYADIIFTISPADTQYFSQKYPHVDYLPAFHPHTHILVQAGKGKFVLYHGNLAVAENHQAAVFILKNIANKLDIPFIIAGANPRQELIHLCKQSANIQLVINPSSEQMKDLIRDAHIHLLPTFQATGIKLKLLHALFDGRFILTNPEMIVDTGLDTLVSVCTSPTEFILEIELKMSMPFLEEEILKRKKKLFPVFDIIANAQRLIAEM